MKNPITARPSQNFWKILCLIPLTAVLGAGIYILFAQFDRVLAQEDVLIYAKESEVTYYEWDDSGQRNELTPVFGDEGFLNELTGSDFLDAVRQDPDNEVGVSLPPLYRLGSSRVLQTQVEAPLLMLGGGGASAYLVFLDGELFFESCPGMQVSLDELPSGEEMALHMKELPPLYTCTVSLPQDYAGRTLTVVEYITPEQAQYWYPSHFSVENTETQPILFLIEHAPKLLVSGMAAIVLLLFLVLFIYQFWNGRRPWPLLLPIMFVFVQMLTSASIHVFNSTSVWTRINSLAFAMYFFCLGDLLLVFVAMKLKSKLSFVLRGMSAAHFLVVTGLLLAQFVAGQNPSLDNLALGWLNFLSIVLAFVLMIRERRRTHYFTRVGLYTLAFVAGYAAVILLYRLTDPLGYIDVIAPIATALDLNFINLNQQLSLFMFVLVTIFSASEYIADLVSHRTRLATLEQVDRLKTEFLGNVAHELKTPLAVMSGYAQASRKKLSDTPEMGEVAGHIRLIGSEADRLALMVSQILDITRIEEGRMVMNLQPASLMEIIQDTVATYAPIFSKNNNTLDLSGVLDLPTVLCDRHRVTQVLVNLLANASRHTQDGKITLSARESGRYVCVTIADTGEGISTDRLSAIFDRYISGAQQKDRPGHETGTGLGLYICRFIVEAHGGAICMESEVGQGTTVSFTLPIKE